jgi:nucleoside-diphosphate-sugar epimerase
MKVAVTGGTGCLGTALIQKLKAEGFGINLLVHPQKAFRTEVRVTPVTGRLDTPNALGRLTRDCAILFHLAAKVHSVPGNKEEEDFFRVNAEGTRCLLEAAGANGVRRIIFYSTVGVYGKEAGFHGDEASPCNPRTAYSRSKYAAERLVLHAADQRGPEGVVLRLPVAYGPGDRGNVAALIRAIRCGYFVHFGDGSARRSMVSSANAADAALRAAIEPKAAGRTFCVTDGTDYSIRYLVETIRRVLGSRRPIFRFPISVGHSLGVLGDIAEAVLGRPSPIDSARVKKLSTTLTFSCQKTREVLGYEPKITLEQGIREEVNWLQGQPDW